MLLGATLWRLWAPGITHHTATVVILPTSKPVDDFVCIRTVLSPAYLQDHETALHQASNAGHTAVVSFLLDHGGEVHAVDKVGRFGVVRWYLMSHTFLIRHSHV